MNATIATNDTFNWWYLIANLGALVGLALLPYLVFIGIIIYQQ
jgi:uncharacterized membrane protein